MEITEEIKALEFKSFEELYAILGEQLLSTTLAAGEFSDEEKREEARNWEKQHETDLRKLIYESITYQLYIKNPQNWDWVPIVAALADIISPIVVSASPFTYAALILKKGLTEPVELSLTTQQPEIESSQANDPLIGLFKSSPDLATRSERILQQDITEKSGWTWKKTQP